jgi:hypothetical protein
MFCRYNESIIISTLLLSGIMNVESSSPIPINIELSRSGHLQVLLPKPLEEAVKHLPDPIDATTKPTKNNTIKAVQYNRFNLIHLFNKIFKRGIVINHLGKNLLININSLKEQTGATNELIQTARRDGNLMQFITMSLALRALKNSLAGQAVKEKMDDGICVESLGLSIYFDLATKEVKLLTTRSAPSTGMENVQDETTAVTQPIFTHLEVPTNTTLSAHVVQLHNDHDKAENLEVGETLGKGAFGKVIKAVGRLGIVIALKYGRKKAGNAGVQDVQKEYIAHRRIFGESRGIWGFQRPISDRFAITLQKKHPAPGEPATKTVIVNRSPIYSGGDYSAKINDPEADRSVTHLLSDFQQMFYTLHYMEQHGMSHGDIKPENILTDQINGVPVVHLVDLASVQFTSDGDPGNSTVYTTQYTSRQDMRLLGSHSTSIENKHLINGKRDVFSMGIVMYMALTGERPYKQGFLGYPATNEPYRPVNDILPGAVPPELDQLLQRMLKFNSDERIGRTEAWNEFNQILAKYPEVQTRIAANMQTLGFDATAIA